MSYRKKLWPILINHRKFDAPDLQFGNHAHAPAKRDPVRPVTLIGFMVWGDVPTLGLLGGSAIVVASELFLLWRETRR